MEKVFPDNRPADVQSADGRSADDRSAEDRLDPAFHKVRLITLYAHIVEVASGLFPQLLTYADMRRLLEINGESIAAKGDDFLGPVLAERLMPLCYTGDDSLDPNSSLAALAEAGALPKSYQARILLVWDLRNNAALAGCCIMCLFKVDRTLGTTRFTPKYCSDKGLPSLDSFLFVDVICSKKSPSGLVSILKAFKIASRTRATVLTGVAAIAINGKALSLLTGLGFASHTYKEQGDERHLCYMRTDDLNMDTVMSRLRFEGSEDILKICFRRGLTAKTHDKIVPRCSAG